MRMRSDDTTAAGLRRISDMSGYKVSDEDPDIRGWNVVGADGNVIGEVDDLLVDTAQMKVRSIDVDVKGADHSLVPADRVQVDRQRKEVRIAGWTGTERFASGTTAAGTARYETGAAAAETAPRTDIRDRDRTIGRDRERLTRSEEELHVGTRQASDEFVVGKHVETEHVEKPVTLRHEEPVIERRPVREGTRADAEAIGSGEIRVPLTHEEAVVEKRPVVKEELVIGKKTVEDQERVGADVRKEEFDIDTSGKSRPRRNRQE
jgi:uncharacterized protein (TIGR02271 family)